MTEQQEMYDGSVLFDARPETAKLKDRIDELEKEIAVLRLKTSPENMAKAVLPILYKMLIKMSSTSPNETLITGIR